MNRINYGKVIEQEQGNVSLLTDSFDIRKGTVNLLNPNLILKATIFSSHFPEITWCFLAEKGQAEFGTSFTKS